MSVKIRLTRTGKTHRPSWRVIATDTRTKRDGKFLEILGYWNPHQPQNSLNLKMDRLDYWMQKGALPSKAVKSLMEKSIASTTGIKV